MTLKRFFLLIMLSQFVCTMLFAETKALIVTIHQKYLRIGDDKLKLLPFLLKNIKSEELGVLGEVVDILKRKIASSGPLDQQKLINAWDESRREWIERNVKGYDKVFFVVGDLLENDDYMRMIWQEAFELDVVDYFSMTHEKDQYIKDAWNVPKADAKKRVVYSEACNGGSGKQHFMDLYSAKASAGHGGDGAPPSASPFFSFEFLNQWLRKKSFHESLDHAWNAGKKILSTQSGFILAQLLGGYAAPEKAILGSVIKYAARTNPVELTMDSAMADLKDMPVVEVNLAQ